MTTASTRVLCVLLLFSTPAAPAIRAAAAASPPDPGRVKASSEDPVSDLGQKELQEAFRVLSRHYIESAPLEHEELNRAALEGLLSRLSFGAALIPRRSDAERDEASYSFYEEIIRENVGYLRPVTFGEKELTRTREALAFYANNGVDTLILDLRTPVERSDFSRAAAFADFFTEPNRLLFKIRKPTSDKAQLFLSREKALWKGRLLVLIDHETGSVAETVAAVLDRQVPCFMIGEATPGRAVQYQEVPLNEKIALRFASAQVVLDDDSPLFRVGVQPRLIATTPPKEKSRAFHQSETKGLARYLMDRQRPRLNEAALVAGDDPELDYVIAKMNGKPTPYDHKPLQDRALQTALATLTAIDFFELGSDEPDETAEP
ncbi:MAG: S41 family peptidase [Verrucomicrobiales bacterium]